MAGNNTTMYQPPSGDDSSAYMYCLLFMNLATFLFAAALLCWSEYFRIVHRAELVEEAVDEDEKPLAQAEAALCRDDAPQAAASMRAHHSLHNRLPNSPSGRPSGRASMRMQPPQDGERQQNPQPQQPMPIDVKLSRLGHSILYPMKDEVGSTLVLQSKYKSRFPRNAFHR